MEKIIKYIDLSQEKLDEIQSLKKELQNESPEIQRFVFYELNRYDYVSYNNSPLLDKYKSFKYNNSYKRIIMDDDKICACTLKYNIYFNKVIYFKSTCLDGFTFDKKTKKIKFWFGGDAKKCHPLIVGCLKEINCDWFFTMDSFFQNKITKTLFEDILNNKITNPESYIKKFMKTSLKYSFHYKLITNYLKTDVFYFRKNEQIPIDNKINNKNVEVIEDDDFSFLSELGNEVDEYKNYLGLKSSYQFNKENMLYCIRDYTIEPNYSLQKIMDNTLSIDYISTLKDMFTQCQITGFKINLHWSYKRLQEEHSKLSKHIAKLKFAGAEKEDVIYFGIPSEYEGINYKILDNNISTYIEGDEMKHCIYSNYWTQIKNKSYFAFSINYPERCTLGVQKEYKQYDTKQNGKIYTPIFKINQVYKKMNTSVTPATRKILEKWIQTDEMQNFFCMNYETFKEEDIKELSEWMEECNDDKSFEYVHPMALARQLGVRQAF